MKKIFYLALIFLHLLGSNCFAQEIKCIYSQIFEEGNLAFFKEELIFELPKENVTQVMAVGGDFSILLRSEWIYLENRRLNAAIIEVTHNGKDIAEFYLEESGAKVKAYVWADRDTYTGVYLACEYR